MLTPTLHKVLARACEVHSHVCSLVTSNNVLTVQDHTGRFKPHTLQSPGMLPVWNRGEEEECYAADRSARARTVNFRNMHLSPMLKHVGAKPFREPTLKRQLQIVGDKGFKDWEGTSASLHSGLSLHFTIIAQLAACTNTLHTIHASGTST